MKEGAYRDLFMRGMRVRVLMTCVYDGLTRAVAGGLERMQVCLGMLLSLDGTANIKTGRSRL
jgi:hypothetical protein